MRSHLPEFDIDDIPFSTRGSWLNLSRVVGLHQRSGDIHVVSHTTGMHAVLRLVPLRAGVAVGAEVSADPAVLTWATDGGGRIRATFESPGVIRIAGSGVQLEVAEAAEGLTPFTGTYLYRDPMDGSFVFTSYETGRRYRVTVLNGVAAATGVESLGAGERAIVIGGTNDGGHDDWEVAVEQLDAAAPSYRPTEEFDEVVDSAARRFIAFLDAVAPWRTAEVPATSLAVYVLWSATVAPAGFLGRESVLMSKHWMDKVWSWDHAFNALALAPGLPGFAIDQFLAPFDHQDASGALPDSITHSEVLYNFVKPPIHGWALRELRTRLPRPLQRAELLDLYERLAAWSRFWLDHRTAPGRTLPHYQHGNDSGWDNSTLFDRDRVIEAPDLAVFLAVQLEVVGELADELGLEGGVDWRRRRDELIEACLAELHDERGFFAVGPLSGAESSRTSLLALLPVLGADLLPAPVRAGLARGIRRHLTEWGLATEPIDSAAYESDGYWRGPIWAPSTLLVENGLRRAGETELADAIAERFLALCERSGFAENFDAVTGEGLRDRAYTWTASVYLVLARDRVTRNG
jgi:hypothetical protein